jgi:hypothetical protein
MNKIMKKLILSGILAFIFTFANTAFAHSTCNDCETSITTKDSFIATYQSYQNSSQYTYVNTNQYPVNTSPTVNDANPGTTVGYATTPVKTVAVAPVKKTTTVKKVAVAPTPKQTIDQPLAPTVNNAANNNSLSANSYSALSWFGAPGFLPNTVFEWILTILLMFILVVLTRQLRPVHVHEAHPAVAHH